MIEFVERDLAIVVPISAVEALFFLRPFFGLRWHRWRTGFQLSGLSGRRGRNRVLFTLRNAFPDEEAGRDEKQGRGNTGKESQHPNPSPNDASSAQPRSNNSRLELEPSAAGEPMAKHPQHPSGRPLSFQDFTSNISRSQSG